MSNGKILSEMIRELDYNPTGKLKRWMINVLTKKEDFPKLVTARKPDMKVEESAETFIGNLCLIYTYRQAFPGNGPEKNADTDYRPYRDLKSGTFKKHLEANFGKIKGKLLEEKNRNISALKYLDKFYSVLCQEETIDIKTQSISDLMGGVKVGDKPDKYTLGDLAGWHRLTELRSLLEDNPDEIVNERKLAEVLYEMRQFDESLEQLDEYLEQEPKDGVAWAIKAKILFEQMEQKSWDLSVFGGNSPYLSALSDARGKLFYEKGRVVDPKLQSKFVDAALNSLKFWPRFNVGNADEYLPSTEYDKDCNIFISRDWLFYHLVMNLKNEDAIDKTQTSSFVSIVRSFSKAEEYHPFPSLWFARDFAGNHETVLFLQRLTLLLKGGAIDLFNAYLNAFAVDFRKNKVYAAEHLKMLTESRLSESFWEFLGPTEYMALYDLLWEYIKESEHTARSTILISKCLYSLLGCFDEAVTAYVQYKNKNLLECSPSLTGITFPKRSVEEVIAKFEKGVTLAAFKKINIEKLLVSELSKEALAPTEKSYLRLKGWLALIGCWQNDDYESRELLSKFVEDVELTKCCFYEEDVFLFELFEQFWGCSNANLRGEKPCVFLKFASALCKEAFSQSLDSLMLESEALDQAD